MCSTTVSRPIERLTNSAGLGSATIRSASRCDTTPGTSAIVDAADAGATSWTIATPGRARSPGVLAGLGLGALAGLGVLSGVIPVIGPAIAGGTLGIILSNAAAGAGVGGLVGALAGAGVPEDEAHYYQGEFESGRTIVTVQADGRADEAMAILRRYDAYDMSSRPDYSGTAGTMANKPMDIPVRSEDVIGGGHRGHGPGGRHGRSRHRPHGALSDRRRRTAIATPDAPRESQAGGKREGRGCRIDALARVRRRGGYQPRSGPPMCWLTTSSRRLASSGARFWLIRTRNTRSPDQCRLFAPSRAWTMTPWNVVRFINSSISSSVPKSSSSPGCLRITVLGILAGNGHRPRMRRFLCFPDGVRSGGDPS